MSIVDCRLLIGEAKIQSTIINHQSRAIDNHQSSIIIPGVNAGKGFIFVSHTGEVYPSGFLPLSAGNVREQSLVTIYRESPLLKELRDYSKLKGKCGYCEYRDLCGGSRSRAYALTGDYLAPEPYCVYRPSGK